MADFELRNQFGDIYIPLPTQLLFHQSTAKRKFFVGVLGSGKTVAGSIEALLKAVEVPGHRPGRTIIARDTYSNLMKSTWDTFSKVVKQTCPALIRDERFSTADVSMTLKNGWEFMGSHLGNYQNFGSLDADNFWIDEINDDGVGLAAYNMLSGRLGRARIGDGTGWGTGNPGGRNWLYDIAFRSHFEGTKPLKGHEGFLPDPKENIHVPENYLDDLRLTYPDEWIAKLLEGSFDVFEGQVYNEFDTGLHVIDPFPIPDEWPRYFGLDHGLTNPTAGVWLAVDYDGNHYIYRTHYKRNSIPASNAAMILSAEMAAGETEGMIQWRVIDPSTKQVQTAGGISQRIIDQYREAGLHCQEGDNHPGAIKSGIARNKQLLQCDEAHVFPRHHPRAGEYGAPKKYVFRDQREYISEAQQYRWKQVKPGGTDRESPVAVHNHLLDADRYIELRLPKGVEIKPADPHAWLKRMLSEDEERGEARDLESHRNYIGARS